MAEQRTCNARVGGSNPSSGSTAEERGKLFNENLEVDVRFMRQGAYFTGIRFRVSFFTNRN